MNFIESKKLVGTKAIHKQNVFAHSQLVFNKFKEAAKTYASEMSSWITDIDPRVIIDFQDKSMFEFWLQVGGDLLIFNLHSNVFSFPPDHPYTKSNYVKENPLRSYCGMIEVYNFLNDSAKYQRYNDVGELISRIFINNENHFFAEGSDELTKKYREYGLKELSNELIQEIIEQTIVDAVSYDLWVPPFQEIKFVPFQYIAMRSANQPVHQTQKRLGFDITNLGN